MKFQIQELEVLHSLTLHRIRWSTCRFERLKDSESHRKHSGGL